jgi:hypothetical protein
LRNRFPKQASQPGNGWRPPCGAIVLALVDRSRLDMLGLGEPTMQPRESAPLWVGLTFVLMVVGTVMYVTGYFVLEDLLTFFK